MIVWTLSAEYYVKGFGTFADEIAIYSSKDKAFVGVQTHLYDGYQKEANFKQFCVMSVELDNDDQSEYDITRFNSAGLRIGR